MATYFRPNLSGNDVLEAPSSGGISEDESWSNNQEYFDASKQLRGSPASRPPHLFRRPAEDLEEEDEEIPSRFELLRRQQVPIEERRKMPGCGINEFDLFDNPIHAETGPIAPDFFRPAHKVYERQPRRRHHYPLSYRYGTAAYLSGEQPPQSSESIPTYHGATILQHSPSPSSSSSSFSTPPPAYEDFQPGLQSSFLGTPPHQQLPIRENQVERHPAYVPSYNIYPPENYYPSPSSSSPPSDQSMFERTPEPEQNRGTFQRVQQVQRVFEEMFPTYSQEDGALHEPDYEEVEEYDNNFESFYSGPDFCARQ